MPRKYSIKPYVAEGYYHVFNQGIDNRELFSSENDYKKFMQYVIEYLEPRDNDKLKRIIHDNAVHYKERRNAARMLNRKNFSDEIKLFAYALLNNNFHLIFQQRKKESMQEFMRSLMTRYSMYYNKLYKRKGTLFESAYKAVQIENDIQLLERSRIVHGYSIQSYPYCSYQYYSGFQNNPAWLTTNLILAIYSKRYPRASYTSYIEGEKISA